jgi:hypothetical protein
MIIKQADDKSHQIASLEALRARRDLTTDVRQRIEREIRNIQAGIKGEKEAAYEIDFHFGPSKNYVVIHDLRIECDGRVAQIDHLVFNRFLDMWVCETKSFSEGIAINEHGECSRFYNNKSYGMASPFEQNRKHIMVLESLFKSGAVALPKRMGITIKPKMHGVVLVSNQARISRPKAKIAGVDTIIKSDQFRTMVEQSNEADSNSWQITRLIGTETLENLARAIVAQHKPIEFDWAAKFGLSGVASERLADTATSARTTPPALPASEPSRVAEAVKEPAKGPKKKLICATCSEPVELRVARFCWFNKARFGDNIYCMECQKGF